MEEPREVDRPESVFVKALNTAAKVPGVRIDRSAYLRLALKRHCTDEEIERAIADNPAAAGISPKIIREAANTSIKYETTKVTGISAVAGIPGGFAMVGTVPADMAQLLAHMMRIAQKLAYIYSWPDLFDKESGEMDEATEGTLTLFIGVMVGVQLAQNGVTKVSSMMAAQALRQLPKKALTKGTIYPIVKNVAKFLGVRMTKGIFASGVAKAIPVIGAVLSGGLTLSTFLPMSKRLQKHLASLELTKPGLRKEPAEATSETPIDLDPVDEESP